MPILTPIKIEFTQDFDLELSQITKGSTPKNPINSKITLGTGLFGRTILEMTNGDDILAFVENSYDINKKFEASFETKKTRKD